MHYKAYPLKSIKLKKHFLSRHYPSVSLLHPLWAFYTIKGADNVLIWVPTLRCTIQKQDLSSYMYKLIYTQKERWRGEKEGVSNLYPGEMKEDSDMSYRYQEGLRAVVVSMQKVGESTALGKYVPPFTLLICNSIS